MDAGTPEGLAARIAQLEEQLARQEADLVEARRQAAAAQRAKTEFLARMSHDLRTPLNAIIGYARIVQRRAGAQLDERQRRNLEGIDTSAQHLLDLLSDILDLARVTAGRETARCRRTELGPLVRDSVASVSARLQPGAVVQVSMEGVETLHTDPERLRRILVNLLDDAARRTADGRITVAARGSAAGVKIRVSHPADGTTQEELAGLLQGFAPPAAGRGTGLGLAVARSSAELLGGTLEACAAQGQETVITLELPHTRGEEPPP